MKATWDDSSESESGSDVEEVARICLMAHSDKDDVLDDEVNLEPPSYDELFETFESMQNDLEKLSSKYVVLKKNTMHCLVKISLYLTKLLVLKIMSMLCKLMK